jgi:cytochrome P450
MKIGRFEIPAGELVVSVCFLAHRRAATYSDPEEFRPERFLEAKPDPYAWFPFGGGARRCLGMAFSLYEMKIVLASVLSRVALRRNGPAPAKVVLRSFMFAPEGGAMVVARRRTEHGARRPNDGAVEQARGVA